MRVRLAFESTSGIGECGTAAGCVEFALATFAWLFFASGGFAILLFAPQHVQAARDVVQVEAERVRDERAAFRAFLRRVDDITPGAVQQKSAGGVGLLAPRSQGGLDEVRTAYRETVMAVDHYEEDYGESLGEHLAVEFGQDVATAVTEGEGVPPGLPEALTTGASEARDVRTAYLDQLEAEDDRLADAADRLTAIEDERAALDDRYLRFHGFEELHDRWERLGTLRDDLRQLLHTQQERRQEDGVTSPRTPAATEFYEYLYASLDVSAPVLADGLTLRDHIDDLDRRLTSALAGRP